MDGLTSAARGLTASEVAQAKTNDVPRRSSRSLSAIVRANVFTLFNLVIGVLWALILIFGEWQDSLFGLVIVANMLIGIIQELRAKRTLDKLAVVNEAPVRVRRDGREHQIPPRQVVLGDLILLGPGDRLLVDGEVAESDGLEVDESLLTGEADPVHKRPGDEVLSGSFAVAGSGSFVATKVGADAYAVKLAEEASKFHLAHSELRAGVANFIKYITWLVIPIGALLIYSQLSNSADLGTAITGAVAGIVTMIPEGLVLLTSIAFAVGVVRLGRRRCLVQELPAIEGLARTDVLCLDKTGTLTAGGMDLAQILPLHPTPPPNTTPADSLTTTDNADPLGNATPPAAADADSGADVSTSTGDIPPVSEAAPAAAAADPNVGQADAPANTAAADAAAQTAAVGRDIGPASAATPAATAADAAQTAGAAISPGDGLIDDALAALANLDGHPNATAQAIQVRYPEARDGWVPQDTVPFSSARKWSGADFGDHGAWVLGAPDVLLRSGDAYDRAAELATTGARVLVLARTDSLAATERGEADVEPAALITFEQRIRPDAQETLSYFAKQGVTVKVISGDNPMAVSAIATSLGIPGGERAIDARTLPHDDPAKLGELLDTHTVFGRVTPRQKREFVRALQARGHTVAMTGDGVNDVLALKDADLGIAMGAGSPATKAVAQVVLMDDRFATLPYVVGEGRRVLANIERVSNLFLTKTFYAIVLSLVVGLAGIMFPFAPRHSTLVNALTIGVPAFFLALAPTLERSKPGFVRRVLRFAVPAGVLCAVAVLLSFWAAHSATSTLLEDQTAAVVTLFLTTWWVLVLITAPFNWWRAGLIGSMAVLFGIGLTLPFVREFFALEFGDMSSVLTAAGISILAAVMTSIAVKVAGTLRP